MDGSQTILGNGVFLVNFSKKHPKEESGCHQMNSTASFSGALPSVAGVQYNDH